MASPERVAKTPTEPLRAPLRPVGAANPTDSLLAQVHDVLAALRQAPTVVGKLSDSQVSDLAEAGMALSRAAEALTVAATAEALDRGITQTSTSASTAQWVRSRGPGVEPGHARRIADVAEHIAGRTGLLRVHPPLDEVLAEAASGDSEPVDDVERLVEVDPSGRLLVSAAVASGAVNVRAASRALQEMPRIRRLIPTAPPGEVLSWFLALGDEATDRDRRQLIRRLVARYDPDQLCRDETTEQAREHLSFHDLPCGMVRMTADLSQGHAAMVKQALSRLSAPDPASCGDPAGGADRPRDQRSPGKRRADALVEVISRGASCLPGAGRGSITGHAKAVVMVDLATLTGRARAAGSMPGTGATPLGDLLDVTTLRQVACSAGIIPTVLGSDGAPLDVGREERLFTGALRTAVVIRDRACTFPGCDRPPDWCEVHHLVPWWAGGRTDLDNGALLCGRHHTIVHRDGLTGCVTDGGVVWDLTPGLLDDRPPSSRQRAG